MKRRTFLKFATSFTIAPLLPSPKVEAKEIMVIFDKKYDKCYLDCGNKLIEFHGCVFEHCTIFGKEKVGFVNCVLSHTKCFSVMTDRINSISIDEGLKNFIHIDYLLQSV